MKANGYQKIQPQKAVEIFCNCLETMGENLLGLNVESLRYNLLGRKCHIIIISYIKGRKRIKRKGKINCSNGNIKFISQPKWFFG